MNRFGFRTSLVVCVSVMAAVYATSAKAIRVQFPELLRTPEKFEGQTIAVVGYLDTTQAHTCDLRATTKRPDDIRALVNIELAQPNDPVIKQLTHGYTRVARVRIVGVFHYKKVGPIKSKPVNGDANVKAIVNMQLGFGWMGLYDKEITDITEIKALP